MRKFKLQHRIAPEWHESTDDGAAARARVAAALHALADLWALLETTAPFTLEVTLSGFVPGDQFAATIAVQNARVALNAAGVEIAEPVLTRVQAPRDKATE